MKVTVTKTITIELDATETRHLQTILFPEKDYLTDDEDTFEADLYQTIYNESNIKRRESAK